MGAARLTRMFRKKWIWGFIYTINFIDKLTNLHKCVKGVFHKRRPEVRLNINFNGKSQWESFKGVSKTTNLKTTKFNPQSTVPYWFLRLFKSAKKSTQHYIKSMKKLILFTWIPNNFKCNKIVLLKQKIANKKS